MKDRTKGKKARQKNASLHKPHLIFTLAAIGTAFIVLLTLFGRRGS